MKSFVTPDYNNCILNISATLAEFLGAPNSNEIIPELKAELGNGYKNVVFICFDGMGMYPIRKNLSAEDFLAKNIKTTILSTFPSTTTNATTSLLTNKLPLEHGWFGWSLYFDNIQRNVDIFKKTDSLSGEKIKDIPLKARESEYYFDKANTDHIVNTVFPPYIETKYPRRNKVYATLNEFFSLIDGICKKEGKQFVYAYCPEPDSTMHRYGVSCNETKKLLLNISAELEKLNSENSDTLFIVTADHGHVDIGGHVYLYEDRKLMDMLETYPFLEPRTPAFKVKEGKDQEFVSYFTEKYGEDFELHRSSELIDNGYFGNRGNCGMLLGDYIGIGTYTYKQAILTPEKKVYKGHHTSLTEEMYVPLITFSSQNKSEIEKT